jgi:DNA-binding response OmpR family regulator
MLRRTGIGVLGASARGALHCSGLGVADLYVLDIPGHARGLDVCRRLRDKTTKPILVLDAVDEAHALEAYAAGADECIPRQVSPAVFLAKVHAWLRFRTAAPRDSRVPPDVAGVRPEPVFG